MNLNEELKKIDDFLNNISPEALCEMLDRNGYGTVGVPLDERISTDYENTYSSSYSLENLLSIVMLTEDSDNDETFSEAA